MYILYIYIYTHTQRSTFGLHENADITKDMKETREVRTIWIYICVYVYYIYIYMHTHTQRSTFGLHENAYITKDMKETREVRIR